MATQLHKTVRFHKAGGSKSIVVPKDFLAAFPFDEKEAELILVKDGILLTPRAPESDLDDPTFVQFLAFLEEAARRHPERLGNILDLTDEDADLVDGVALDE
jgi:hypothetical protein